MASTTRQALLQALSAAEGAYISGQQLAQQLGVSRAAVHKAAAALTAQGYALEAASRRGYRLLGGDPFCTEAVGPYPAPVQLYDTLESTNRTAKLLALEGAAHGTLVLAGVHLCFAFPFIHKLLILFNLDNRGLLIGTTAVSFAVFAVLYAIVYKLTGNTYYRIVAEDTEKE